MNRRDFPPLLATDCPRCGTVADLVVHLRAEHGFNKGRARAIAIRLARRERLSAGDCRQLGVPLQAALRTMRRRVIERETVPEGLPDDRTLDRVIRAAFP